MKHHEIMNIGKFTFGISFLVGSLSFFGGFFGHIVEFVIFEKLIFCLLSLINIIVFLGLQLYGIIHRSQIKTSFKSSLIILINVPIIFLYACLIYILN